MVPELTLGLHVARKSDSCFRCPVTKVLSENMKERQEAAALA